MGDDLLRLFGQKRVEDRNLNTLIGLAKGLAADGVVNQAESEFLQGWLRTAEAAAPSEWTSGLLRLVDQFLSDGRLDAGEAAELLEALRQTAGEDPTDGEIRKPASLPLDDPPPRIVPDGKVFAFTGIFTFGSRQMCWSATESRGGVAAENVTKSTNYLAVGSYVNDLWAHEACGRKIQKAMHYRSRGVRLSIIDEQHWIAGCGLGEVHGARPRLRLVKG